MPLCDVNSLYSSAVVSNWRRLAIPGVTTRQFSTSKIPDHWF